MAGVTLIGVSKAFGKVLAVRDFTLTVRDGEFVVLVGPSGCGKTTLLRMVAGLEQVTKGEIRIGDVRVNDLPPKDRDVAMVFQNYALYPHMNVYENMAFGLRMRRLPQREIDARVREAAAVLGIDHLLKRRPRELSGGERQRVALGRAMVRRPKVFLLDEPLSNLDAKMRLHMRAELKRLHARLQVTSIYVTHDQIEAMTMGDRIVVMKDGVIQQVGTPGEIYNRPRNLFVATFVGTPSMNLFPVRLEWHESAALVVGKGLRLVLPPGRVGGGCPRDLVLGVRPQDMTLVSPQGNAGMGTVRGEVEVVEPMGAQTMLHCSADGQQFTALVSPEQVVRPGDVVVLAIDTAHIHLFDSATGLSVDAVAHDGAGRASEGVAP